MPNFTALLISTCTVESKSLSLDGYEQTQSWQTLLENIATRKDSADSASISDGQYRENTDDDLFFFNTADGIQIERGMRIIFDGDQYDVIKVNKVYGGKDIHHVEVVARLFDHK